MKRLLPFGLSEVRPRIWVDKSETSIRRVFDLLLLKGAGMRARWGFSLDFVPHISGGQIRWHRRPSSARFDIVVEPTLPVASYLYGTTWLMSDLGRLAPVAIEGAREIWRNDSLKALLRLVLRLRERPMNVFPSTAYVQESLACAFLMAKLGDLSSAERELDQYFTRLKIADDVADRLRQLVAQCDSQFGKT